MGNRYSHLLQPLELGSVLLKNRMTAAAATPHFIQGTEPYPTEKWITMLANRARSGAAAVNINHLETGSTQESTPDFPPDHFSIMDFRKTTTHNYLCQAIDAIRYYGSIAQYPLGYNMLDETAGQGTPGILAAQGGAAGGPVVP
ncbi:MAG: hypothetical protein E7430_08010, partial [Ruminococcaceae bacterium]|nr:hypothetical protein [Oscillospiraceae bacterium]